MANTFPNTRIGIIGAMQVEIDLLIQTMERQGAVSMSSIAGRDFYEGNLKRNTRCSGSVRCRHGECRIVRPSTYYLVLSRCCY